MPDMENVIYDIERCICNVPDACRDCSHYTGTVGFGCMEDLMKDALATLKEQEPIRCKDCAYALFKEGVVEHGYIACTKPYTERWQVAKPNNWFCADGKRAVK